MPATWTTNEQKAWLFTKVPGFVEARGRSRSTAYAKGVHKAFSDIWPEVDPPPTPTHSPTEDGKPGSVAPLFPEDDEVLRALRLKRGKILAWLQRNSTQRGRMANRAVKHLMNVHGVKRRRTYQPGEVYNKLYPTRVAAVYEDRKVEGMTRGQRLNLIKKISDELLEEETEDVQEEVANEQVKRREELNKTFDDSDVEAAMDELTRQEYIDGLPELLNCVLKDVGKYCPDWGFLILAAGPMPKANHSTHVFDLYNGPKTIEGYTFPDAHENFDARVRVPFGKFVREEHDKTSKRDRARKELDALEHRISVEPEDSDSATPTQVVPRRRNIHRQVPEFTDSDEGQDSVDDEEEYEEVRSRKESESSGEDGGGGEGGDNEAGSDDEDNETDRGVKVLQPTTRGKSSKSSKAKLSKHPLEVSQRDGGSTDDEEEAGEGGVKTGKEADNAAPIGCPSVDEVPPKPRDPAAAKRDAATQKRLATREKNKAEAAELKAQAKAAEVARLEEVKMMDVAKTIQTAREAEAVKKAAAAAKKAAKKVNTNAVVVETRADTEPTAAATIDVEDDGLGKPVKAKKRARGRAKNATADVGANENQLDVISSKDSAAPNTETKQASGGQKQTRKATRKSSPAKGQPAPPVPRPAPVLPPAPKAKKSVRSVDHRR
ncbi:hypothetical protein BDN72DRAFT_905402 [Pluteus cervinus]|uniref:Uncharacterized protein n=1 Tax=Pluteus cervinus TaxID=181527 RepID=A0ACD3A2I6_9AGAR|nr:hypothetical protein BDN72DRAFT_905402 [Pluteus cervinus]